MRHGSDWYEFVEASITMITCADPGVGRGGGNDSGPPFDKSQVLYVSLGISNWALGKTWAVHVLLLWIICVVCVFCSSCFRVCSLLPCGRLGGGEGWLASCLLFVMFIVVLLLSHLISWVRCDILDCIDS